MVGTERAIGPARRDAAGARAKIADAVATLKVRRAGSAVDEAAGFASVAGQIADTRAALHARNARRARRGALTAAQATRAIRAAALREVGAHRPIRLALGKVANAVGVARSRATLEVGSAGVAERCARAAPTDAALARSAAAVGSRSAEKAVGLAGRPTEAVLAGELAALRVEGAFRALGSAFGDVAVVEHARPEAAAALRAALARLALRLALGAAAESAEAQPGAAVAIAAARETVGRANSPAAGAIVAIQVAAVGRLFAFEPVRSAERFGRADAARSRRLGDAREPIAARGIWGNGASLTGLVTVARVAASASCARVEAYRAGAASGRRRRDDQRRREQHDEAKQPAEAHGRQSISDPSLRPNGLRSASRWTSPLVVTAPAQLR